MADKPLWDYDEERLHSLQRLTESLHVCCVREKQTCVVWHVFTCVCLWVSEPARGGGALPQTVLSSIHSVLLNVTLLLARGDGSVLSWLVDLCHLVLARRG